MKAAESLLKKLTDEHRLDREGLLFLMKNLDRGLRERLYRVAGQLRDKIYGREVYMRGLIEFSNYCKNDCLYCGIRRNNGSARRYRLSPEAILECCRIGHEMGFRSFVLQSGEDPWWDDDRTVSLIRSVRSAFPDSAITLSMGEKSRQTYEKYYQAGADRYLLRHETVDPRHYAMLHPRDMKHETRIRCLRDLRGIGLQTGAGFMVGSPFQTEENLADDLLFMKAFAPHMVGIGPFLPHSETPFAGEPAGSLRQTIDMVAITRLLLPQALLPATTALGTLDPSGREMALNAGANVVMPNLSPQENRKDYAIYDNKISTGEEAVESRAALETRLSAAGYHPSYTRGDHPEMSGKR